MAGIHQTPPLEGAELFTIGAGLPSCGSKHAHLEALNLALPQEEGGPRIPSFFGITDGQIKALFSHHTIALWKEVQKKGYEVFRFDPEDNLLEHLQASITQDIMKGDLSLSPAQQEVLLGCQGKVLMVRSSSNEDSATTVNAGGNLSLCGIEPTEESLKQAVSQVVASYFSFQSLRNRSNTEDPFREFPLCGVLVMDQIGETGEESPPVSGVMMTHKLAWIPSGEGPLCHIVASWGHGHGVVSGKTPCDEWMLSKNISYPIVRFKPQRCVAGEKGAIEEVVNPPDLRSRPVLSERQLAQLQKAAHRIEGCFKQAMDVEFVFQKDQLYIVQARPQCIPERTSKPTFIDPASLPSHLISFQANTLLPGSNQVFVSDSVGLVFARDLEEAEQLFSPLPDRNSAVIIYKEPESANTHAEVNFASQKPPIPCFVLSKKEWEDCKRLASNACKIVICPQTGKLICCEDLPPMQQGLFVHPARFPISVSQTGRGLHGISSHPSLMRLQELLTTTAEQLQHNLDEIGTQLNAVFVDILSRQTCMGSLREIAERLHTLTKGIFEEMQEAAASRQPTLLTFHASAFRQLLTQTAPQVIGSHSLAGLEAATHCIPELGSFIEKFGNHQTLCELALMGRKAFDASTQSNWLALLRQLSTTTPEEQWDALLKQLKDFDQLDQLPLWFSIHFARKKASIPIVALIADNESMRAFLSAYALRIQSVRALSAQTAAASSPQELRHTWEALQKESQEILAFCAQKHPPSPLRTIQLSSLLYELIQLWDRSIKIVETSQITPEGDASVIESIHNRLINFAAFGKKVIQSPASSVERENKMAFLEVLDAIFTPWSSRVRSGRPFSLAHWLVPRGHVFVPIETDDQRLSVIHQNLLKAIGPNVYSIRPHLPTALAEAVEIFREEHLSIVKRFEKDKGEFAQFTPTYASVTINVPLNFHSFVLTMRKAQGSETLDFIAEWRASDNFQGYHLDFFHALAEFDPLIQIKSSYISGDELKVVFSVSDEAQTRAVCRAIYCANDASLHSHSARSALKVYLSPNALEGKEAEEYTLRLLVDRAWTLFIEGKELNPVFQEILRYDGRMSPQREELLPKIFAGLRAELQGSVPGNRYLNIFGSHWLSSLPHEEQKELCYANLTGPQHTDVHFSEDIEEELLPKLQTEHPEKWEQYLAKRAPFGEDFGLVSAADVEHLLALISEPLGKGEE